jgi:two-component system NtrC family sensor kinase
VKELLEFSREPLPEKETIALDAILDEVAAFFHQQPDFKHIDITKNFALGLPHVFADPGQVRQVFMNLVINAGQAMPQGGKLDISTYLSKDGNGICAEIKDSGCGIPADDLSRVFDPFFTTKPEGTGLGLSISYGIVVSNGGRIEVRSDTGEGSAFVVILPAAV